ncbi:MAG: extracellular solute-binding protein, partial [Oscillospiraceae bacterium]|nr:extracellular solute-binding protein [Oscillospiraceae bacterium]
AAAVTTAAAAEAGSPPVPITWINRLNATFVVENNPVIDELGRITNTVIDLEAPPINNYDDRRNIVMASGDIPDIIYGGTGVLYEQWAAEGLILQLDEYLDRMPNVLADLSELELNTARIPDLDYGLYSLPRIQTKAVDAIGYRGDWLDRLGMEIPLTAAEFADVAYAMAHNDPDGNGQKDTYGFSFQIETLNHRYTTSCFFAPDSVPDENGEYNIIEAKPGYMDYMDWLRGMFESGAMDPEWYLNERYGEADKFSAGKVGIRALDTTTAHTMDMFTNNDLITAFPGYQHLPGPVLRAEGEARATTYWFPPVWGNWYINANTKNLDAVLALIDFGFTDAGHILTNYGVEGLHYDSIDLDLMIVDRTLEQREEAGKYASSYLTFRHRSPGDKTWSSGNTQEEIEEFVKRETAIRDATYHFDYLPSWEAVTPGVSAVNQAIADLQKERDTMITKYICMEINRDELVSFFDDRWIPANADKVAAITAAQPNK